MITLLTEYTEWLRKNCRIDSGEFVQIFKDRPSIDTNAQKIVMEYLSSKVEKRNFVEEMVDTLFSEDEELVCHHYTSSNLRYRDDGGCEQ